MIEGASNGVCCGYKVRGPPERMNEACVWLSMLQRMRARKRLLKLRSVGEKMSSKVAASKCHEVSGQTKMEDGKIESTGVERTGDRGE